MNSTSPSFLLEMTKIPDWEIPLVQENLEMMKVNPTKELKKKKLSISNFSSFTMKKPKPNIQIGPHPKLLRSFHCFGKRKKTSKKLLQKPIQQLQEDQINPLHQRMRSDWSTRNFQKKMLTIYGQSYQRNRRTFGKRKGIHTALYQQNLQMWVQSRIAKAQLQFTTIWELYLKTIDLINFWFVVSDSFSKLFEKSFLLWDLRFFKKV